MLIVGDDVLGKFVWLWGRYELLWGLFSCEFIFGLDKFVGGCCEICYLRIIEYLKVV